MTLLAVLSLAVAIFATVAVRDHRRVVRARREMLDDCISLFEDAKVEIRPDGHPRLHGACGGRQFRVALLTDTFAPKRLPQLWLAVAMPAVTGTPRLAITLRPRTEDVVTLAQTMNVFLATPDWLPDDCVVRADDPRTSDTLTACRASLAAAFADPRLKEIAFGPAALRLVYQADEGRRGAHLLLRQARFDRPVAPETLIHLREVLRQIERDAVSGSTKWAA